MWYVGSSEILLKQSPEIKKLPLALATSDRFFSFTCIPKLKEQTKNVCLFECYIFFQYHMNLRIHLFNVSICCYLTTSFMNFPLRHLKQESLLNICRMILFVYSLRPHGLCVLLLLFHLQRLFGHISVVGPHRVFQIDYFERPWSM